MNCCFWYRVELAIYVFTLTGWLVTLYRFRQAIARFNVVRDCHDALHSYLEDDRHLGRGGRADEGGGPENRRR
jgi:hypothetical protein